MDLDYNELLKFRQDVDKLGKVLEGAQPPESSILSRNLLTLMVNAWAALGWFADHLISNTLKLREERLDGSAAQTAMDFVPSDKVIGMEATREAVKHFLDVQSLGAEPESPTYPDSPIVDDDPDGPSSAKVRQLLAQVQTDRTLPPSCVFDDWTPAERIAAARWAYAQIQGADAPPPECVSRRFLEDLDLEEIGDRVELLSWLGIKVVEDVEWSSDLWDEVLSWAVPAHGVDRGERGVEVPAMPAIFLPSEEVVAEAKAIVAEGGATYASVVERIEGHGASLALAALIILNEVTVGTDGVLSAPLGPEVSSEASRVRSVAEELSSRRIMLSVGRDGTVEVFSVGDAEDEADEDEDDAEEPSAGDEEE